MCIWKRLVSLAVCSALLIQLAGCGIILYPERKGQKPGRIDPGVAILDAVGLFFFIIPGVIAFAVDFGTGAIYLPGTADSGTGSRFASDEAGTGDMRMVQVDPALLQEEYIEAVVANHTGKNVDLSAPGVILREARSGEAADLFGERARM